MTAQPIPIKAASRPGESEPATSDRRRPVLVLDGEQRAALAVVRSLGRAGYETHVASSQRASLAGGSRFAATEVLVPNPLAFPGAFIQAVAARTRALAADFVVPVTDAAALALLPCRERLTPATIPLPELNVYRRVADKAAVLEHAPNVGIAVPRQIVLDSPACRCRLEDLAFPVVIKTSRSVVGNERKRQKLDVVHAASRQELAARLAQYPAEAYPVLIQQRVVGPGIGIFLLQWDGEMIAAFSHRRIREKPPAGGISVYRESIAADPGLVARSRALLTGMGWQGVAMVEYKVDAATGVPYLMEVNGRFWGSLQLAVDAGVDFPKLLLAAAAGERPAPVTDYAVGIRSRWWWGEVDHLIARLRRNGRDLGLPPQAPSRGRALLDFLSLWAAADRYEILRRDDPLPFIRETLHWILRS